MERSGDFLALAGLFAVSVSGLFLTVSSTWLEGRAYSALNTIHALTVILGLMYLPFGKLFHIFQRPGNLGVAYYKRANAEGAPAVCRRCGEPFASAQQIADSIVVDDDELTVMVRRPRRDAASIWLRMRAKSGEISRVGPRSTVRGERDTIGAVIRAPSRGEPLGP